MKLLPLRWDGLLLALPLLTACAATQVRSQSQESADKAAIADYVKQQLQAIQGCYEQQQRLQPALVGRMTAKLTVAPDGTLAPLEVREDTLQSPPVRACITALAGAWRVPSKLTGTTSVVFRWTFRPSLPLSTPAPAPAPTAK